MNGLKLAALAAFLAAVGLLVYGASQGDVGFTLFLIVPIVHGSGLAAAGGMLLLFAAMVLWFAGTVRDATRLGGWGPGPVEGGGAAPFERRTERRSGGMVLLGPIPIVWGSDRGVRKWMVLAGLAMLALWLLAALLLRP